MDDLTALARKTFILITTVGPYGRLGEAAFRACAESGTHYLDVTGEVPFVHRMITKYSATATSTGALMFPQIGIESAPSDLVTWTLASLIRSNFNGAPTRDVTVSLRIKGAPSGGTLSTALTLLDNFSMREAAAAYKPFALSPVPNPNAASAGRLGLMTRLTGLIKVPVLGLQTSSIAARTDGALVERTWGLLESTPTLKGEAYGPNFSFRQFMRAKSALGGIGIHFGLMVFGIILATPFLRRFLAKRVTQPGEGASLEDAAKDEVEYRGIGRPDVAGGGEGKVAYCRAWFKGPNYYREYFLRRENYGGLLTSAIVTGILLAEAAATLLQDDIDKKLVTGGVYTSACLGRGFIDRLDEAGFHFESKIVQAD